MVEPIEAAARAVYRCECEARGEPDRWAEISPESQAYYGTLAQAAIDANERKEPGVDVSKIEDLRRKTRKNIGISTSYISDIAMAKTAEERVEIYRKTIKIFRKDIGELTASRASLLERNSVAVGVMGRVKRQIDNAVDADPDWLRRAQRSLSLAKDEKQLTEKRIGQIRLAISERNNAITTIGAELKRAEAAARSVGRPVGAGDDDTYVPGTSTQAASAIAALPLEDMP